MKMEPRTAYLKNIKVEEGMFPNEKVVTIRNYDGEEISGFFNNKFVKDGKLEVLALDEQKDKVTIKFKGQPECLSGNKNFNQKPNNHIIVNKEYFVY